jgi:hypothetical protein
VKGCISLDFLPENFLSQCPEVEAAGHVQATKRSLCRARTIMFVFIHEFTTISSVRNVHDYPQPNLFENLLLKEEC